MHRPPKRFGLEGIIGDDADFPRLRAEYEDLLIQDMRDAGYIPVLDLGPYFATSLTESGKYEFKLSIYGMYVGKRKSWDYIGVDGHGTLFPNSSQKGKSSQS